MPTSILEEVNDLLEIAEAQGYDWLPEYALRFTCPVGSWDAIPARTRATKRNVTVLQCPACGSAHVAQVLGDNGGISYVCTSCGHSWS
ncbi:hypothetical protein [Streptomyces zagrosensis]|uniref:Putative RNA-binding Zn-ribbon protein involved in translation (DUF1610 family) n=1 Tax=Streptomyces zagrosensis TaxID=1042984 RepID=A0A7W9Q3L7_9ACTN|nr:hypothetical protein [Streptomyces zagrosensis]MBB5933008.1 putative RNA-binding Zn-ribbon protein involved in translation (DUF1610 family) [Streptomyces zagrosensis]